MKFKRYIKESTCEETKITLSEDFGNPDEPVVGVKDVVDNFYKSVKDLIAQGKFEDAKLELDALEADLNEFEAANAKKKFFKFPQFMINNERKRLEMLRSQLPMNESIEDMDKRCEKCNTLLNDQGTCPKCDDGEEDYEDKLEEKLTAREKLKAAFPELNFDRKPDEVTEAVTCEEHNVVPEEGMVEELSNREKLLRAYPELNFDRKPVKEDCDAAESVIESAYEEYDDDYSIEDVKQDRVHAALYGGEYTCCDTNYDDDTECIPCEDDVVEDEFDDSF